MKLARTGTQESVACFSRLQDHECMTVFGWFTSDHTALVSLAVAALALLASVWATLVSRKSVKAAMRSASAAEEQVEAAVEQVRQAREQSSTSREAAEVDALSAAKSRIDEAAPHVTLVLSPLDDTPRIEPREGIVPVPHPPITHEPEDQKLDWREVHGDQVYVVLHGILINDDSHAVRVYPPSTARFYAGPHPGNEADVGVPTRSGTEGCHVLEAGQVALFEMHVRQRIEAVLKRAAMTDDDRDLPFSRDKIQLIPGHLDEPQLIVEITTYAEPFRERYTEDGQVPLVMRAHAHLNVIVKRTPVYPRSFAHLHAELRGDEQKLRSLQQADELRRMFDRPYGNSN
jgi:hypothetical protein